MRVQCGIRLKVPGAFDAVVLRQARFIEIKRLRFKCRAIFRIEVDQLYLIEISSASSCTGGSMNIALGFVGSRTTNSAHYGSLAPYEVDMGGESEG